MRGRVGDAGGRREYDRGGGLFTQEDPIGIAGGLNLYGYAGGDPINFSDPFGLCKTIEGTTAPCILFAVVMGEARGASREFQIGVTNVIKNRANLVGGDYDAVINQRGQFSAMNASDPNRSVVDATLNEGVVTDAVKEIVEAIFAGSLGDNTDGALLYFSPQSMVPAGSTPRWNFSILTKTLDLGEEGQFFRCTQGSSCWQRPSGN